PAPYCLRCSYGLKYPSCKLRCALALDEVIQNVGHETVSAFLAETVSGATLATCPPPEDYFTVVRDICDHYNVLLILDEVMCGLGRTGRWFAAEHFNVSPDIMTLGKGLAGGAAALSAVGVQSKHFETIVTGSGQFVHGGTFSHHNVAAAAGLEVLSILEREHLIERAEKIGELINIKLKERFENHKHVGDIRGIGCMWGIEIVKDKEKLTPFPRSEKIAEKLWNDLFENGVIVYRAVGLAGIDGDAFMIAPPFIIKEEEIDIIVDAIEGSFKKIL
ncbi:MAG: aminotransferase class III-fold pyridoxal phosphate-dependent enzyme, partial [Deltaproteobacteria bacterium]|nr:aminotransferase class III-fold pyridoxal phosphate-dependent enzyme [Deltaproteobacteria bacterium]